MTEFGISIIPYADSVERNRELVRVADEGGLALVGIQDHPYQRHFMDTWSLIPTLMAETKRISFFTDVASLPLRPPAVMAKAAASLDVLSGGRFELGLGGGALPELISNFDGPKRTPGETVEAVDEAIDVLRLLWSSQRSVSFDGKHYQLHDARPGPTPAHPIGIWLGAFKPRMLRSPAARPTAGCHRSAPSRARNCAPATRRSTRPPITPAATPVQSAGSSISKASSATNRHPGDPNSESGTSRASRSPDPPIGGCRR